jgi:multidrug efflux pump subunit AcrA (membrane-fusion protein)
MNPKRWFTTRTAVAGGLLAAAAVTALALLGSSGRAGSTTGASSKPTQAAQATKSGKAKPDKAVASKTKNQRAKSDEPLPTAVELAEVRRGPITTWLPGTSALEPRNAASLVAESAGRIVRLHCEEGDRVAAGAVLAEIDDREARLAVERTEIGAETTKREAERGATLLFARVWNRGWRAV